MAFTNLLKKERDIIWPGDAVFDYNPANAPWEIHVGVYVGADQEVAKPDQELDVRGLPERRGGSLLGVSVWGAPGNYRTHFIGRRRDFRKGEERVGRARVGQVKLLSEAVATEHSQLGSRCEWKRAELLLIDERRRIRDRIPLFIRGTCSQFVEYLYEWSGLDLIEQSFTFNPSAPKRIYPATHVYVFWSGGYGLRTRWDRRYETYPDCLFGRRSVV